MSTELRLSLIAEIDQQAARERAKAEFIIGIIDARYDELYDLFRADEMAPEQAPRHIYTQTEALLSTVESLATRIGNIPCTRAPVDHSFAHIPGVALGWIRYIPSGEPSSQGTMRYFMLPTKAGVAVVDGLRSVRGKESVDQERQRHFNQWGL